jgi:hypothetical protein
MFVFFHVRSDCLADVIQSQLADGGIGIQGVCPNTSPFGDMVFEQPVNNDYVCPDDLVVVVQFLNPERAVVEKKFQIEGMDVGTGIAVAGRVDCHQINCPSERNIGVLDHFHERLTLEEVVSQAVADDRITCQSGDDERGVGVLDEQIKKRGQGLLGVVKLRLTKEAGVAGDIGNEEITILGGGHWTIPFSKVLKPRSDLANQTCASASVKDWSVTAYPINTKIAQYHGT